jgi:hypothetical protein
VAVLLAPFYRTVAMACWKNGAGVVFDPTWWWQGWRAALADTRGASSQDAAPAEGGTAEAADSS